MKKQVPGWLAFLIVGVAVAVAGFFLYSAYQADDFPEGDITEIQLEYEALMEKAGGDLGKLSEAERQRLMEIRQRPDAPVTPGG